MKAPFVPNAENQVLRLDTNAVASHAGGPGLCELCGLLHELRPAGLHAEMVCLVCAAKDPAALAAYTRRWLGLG